MSTQKRVAEELSMLNYLLSILFSCVGDRSSADQEYG